MTEKYDAIVIGGGHNSLVAACYLAKENKKVLLLERNPTLGGATASVYAFDGVAAKLSRYSYLVALLPDQIRSDLELNFETISRTVSSYTPARDSGILVNRVFDDISRNSISNFTKNETDSVSWEKFYDRIAVFAKKVAPTMLEPLPTTSQIRSLVGEDLWQEFVETPLCKTLDKYFVDDVIKGIVLTDGLIGTFASACDKAANICFLYHLIGNGTGEWKVPKGGMGKLVEELTAKAGNLGVEIRTETAVTSVIDKGNEVEVSTESEKFVARVVLAGCSPRTLSKMSSIPAPKLLDGSQLKINMVLSSLPELKSGIDPRIAFSGTFHINESLSQLETAYEQSKAGKIPDQIPAEMYCHTLTDRSILSSELQSSEIQTLTVFVLHTPASLFENNHDQVKAEITEKVLSGLNNYLKEPIEGFLLRDSSGKPCIEVKTPQELEAEIDLPRGNIFHGDLEFPWKGDDETIKWGSETISPRIFIAGAGARRGGGVSGIAGHNAARAALERLAKSS
jgi:phytoene dehydrogenase-like protein